MVEVKIRGKQGKTSNQQSFMPMNTI